jgi:predicted alpha/beta-hydrolase family hydrolase
VLVVITPMPLNLAIFNTKAAAGVITDFPYISRWILTGHSLGGAAAAIFSDNDPAKIDGIVFWDSYPPNSSNLTDIDIPVLSIYGTMDGFPNTKNFNDKRQLIPTEAIFNPIEGAYHAQFGDYGPQKGDVVAKINMKEQHDIVAKIMLDFIFRKY